MKKLLIPVTLLSLFFASCQKQNSTPEAVSSTPKIDLHAYAKINWKMVWNILKEFLPGPSVSFSYKSGYYQFAPTDNNPDGFNCLPGDAVCEFTITASFLGGDDNGNPFPNDYGEAMMGFDRNGSLKIYIPKAVMTEQTFNEHYADNVMTIPADWTLQKGLTDALGLPAGYTIPKGDYPIETINVEGTPVLMATLK